MLENQWLFEEPNSVAGFNDSNELYGSQKEIGKLNKRLHDMQIQLEKEEKGYIMLREADKTDQRRAEEAEKQMSKLRGCEKLVRRNNAKQKSKFRSCEKLMRRDNTNGKY